MVADKACVAGNIAANKTSNASRHRASKLKPDLPVMRVASLFAEVSKTVDWLDFIYLIPDPLVDKSGVEVAECLRRIFFMLITTCERICEKETGLNRIE